MTMTTADAAIIADIVHCGLAPQKPARRAYTVLPATTPAEAHDGTPAATSRPFTRDASLDAADKDAWWCASGHVTWTASGARPLTCPHCEPAHPCPNCGGQHKLRHCGGFLAALANPGAAVARMWLRDRRAFLLAFGAWDAMTAESVAQIYAAWCGFGDAQYWLKVWTAALAGLYS
jgi:hypothetical protein